MTTTLPDHLSKPNSLDTLLKEQHEQRPGLPLLIVRKGIAATPAFKAAIGALLEQIQVETQEPVVLTALSNATVEFNPWSGLASASDLASDTSLLEGLVSLLAPGEIIEWHSWPEHCVYISAAAVEALAGTQISPANALHRLQQAGGKLLISDTLFLHDASSDLFDEDVLQPHEHKQPPAWGLLRERLDAWLKLPDPDTGSSLAQSVADFRSGGKPATLHVTHSWGGGIARWIESFIEADDQGINFQLRSEGPQTGKGYGQRLSLYLGNLLDAPVASWWLQPAIISTESAHPQYKQVLTEIAERYGISRLIVSSLVGHSLDALCMKLPTLQVLHDFYPLWPLLGINPLPYLGHGPENCLEAALRKNTLLPGLRDRSAQSWKALARQWRECVVRQGIQVVAPSHSVARLMAQLDPAWSDTDIRIVPHGLLELPGDAEVLPRDREDGRLRLVVPGRIQEGKGQRLLMEALPELDDLAQVYLLGSGKEGELFFGKSGVNVVIQYAREDLRELLAGIGPHVAGLLSVVPETFSYTLSEMQQLGIPVIATRVGSLEERIDHDETGWLIEPDPLSLVEQLRTLATNREQISAVRQRLETLQQADLPGMIEEYRAICSPGTARRSLVRLQSLEATQISSLAFENTELQAKNALLNEQTRNLQTEIEKRTAWADDLEKARKDEVKRRIEWVAALESQIDEMQGNLDHEQAAHRQTNLHLEKLRSVHQWVLNTASWRFTKPFRVLGRMFQNLGRARAWNPLRWPLLLSQVVRTLSTQGLSGALDRSQATRVRQGKIEIAEPVPVDAIGDPEPPAEFPVVENPDVSIIIPVYNKWAYTAACLRSLAETPCDSSFEVIVVDDQSSDETSDYLAGVKGLINLRNEENMGFVRSCNRGAAEARGQYIVMLNNDTQVLKGWLDSLLDTFQQHPDTGIAGASLVYPDGKLQEAGGIIFNDGSGWNYGKGDDPDRPDYQYTREVDYCSGACIMLETGLFRELGGFDMLYAPAYYEDTDLAFRVRAKGLKVRVQPSAVIVHHEGITSGTDLNEGAKSYQVVNRDKFLKRWLDELSFYPDPIHDPEDKSEIRRARDHRLKGRVLIVDAYTPEPDQDSGSVRLGYLMDCLVHLGYGVTFLPDNRAHAGQYTTALQKSGIEVVYDPWIDSLPGFFSERGGEFDFVMVSRHYVASNYISLVRRHCPKAKLIFDTVDLHYLREERMAELEESLPLKSSAALTKRSELAVINAADATLVVSPVEKTVLKETTPEAKVHVVSNIHEVVGCQRTFAQRKDIFFVGGYQHPPNIDAAEWFVKNIWPLIHKELPEMEFHLIGSKAPEQVRALHGNGVRFHGFVKTLEPWLDGCRLAVAPLRYGAGIKGKVNMSMSRGQPVVATPMAVEGMFAQSGRDVLVAETAEEFAADVIRLYQDEDLWNQVSVAGLENVRQYFSLETARLSLQALLNSLH